MCDSAQICLLISPKVTLMKILALVQKKLTKVEKTEVLDSVRLELIGTFRALESLYGSPSLVKNLSELENIKIFLKEKLAEYEHPAV